MVYMHLFLFSFRSVLFFFMCSCWLVISQCFDQLPLFTLFQFDSFPTQTGLEIMILNRAIIVHKTNEKTKKNTHTSCALQVKTHSGASKGVSRPLWILGDFNHAGGFTTEHAFFTAGFSMIF